MNTTVIVQRFLNILLVFLNVRGWTKGGQRPPGKPLLYPPEQTSNNFVGCHRVQRFFEYTLEFSKYERLDKGGPKAPDKPLLYPLEKTLI